MFISQFKIYIVYDEVLLFNLQQAKAEQEEEYISNTLLKKIQALKKEKETLAHHYEREEECLTNDLSRKLNQVIQLHTAFFPPSKLPIVFQMIKKYISMIEMW